ncbi:MAG: hypothetical protein R6X34_06065 [Chloroflexota bacterium]
MPTIWAPNGNSLASTAIRRWRCAGAIFFGEGEFAGYALNGRAGSPFARWRQGRNCPICGAPGRHFSRLPWDKNTLVRQPEHCPASGKQ